MYLEGSYKQLLYGVSQQAPLDRLDGQNAEQINMTSDLTFNLRRRAPVQFVKYLPEQSGNSALSYYSTTVADLRVFLAVDGDSGELCVYSTDGTLLLQDSAPYLATAGKDIRFATLGDAVYVCNLKQVPTEQAAPVATAYPDPTRAGFFYVLGGQYGKKFRLTVTKAGTSTTVEYQAPDGSNPGDSEKTTPEYIAEQLVNAAKANPTIGTSAGFVYYRESGYVFLQGSVAFEVSTDSGSTYMLTSSVGNMRSVSNLPARLPDSADGYIVSTGTGKVLRYYRWETDQQRWLEDAAYSAQVELTNMPIKVTRSAGTWAISTGTWEKRSAGDSESNPTPHFVESGITGIASFQGRLVLLANQYVCMSASSKPERFYRSTLEQLQADDPIEVASTTSQAAPYKWASAFNADLVLWADAHQSIVNGRTALTPSNANLAVINQYTMRDSAEPVVTGRNVFFAAPRSAGYDGVWEMSPGDYVQSQLVGADVTNHIPRYAKGAVRFMSASTTTNILVVGFDEERSTLLVHEYLWAEGTKVHHAWHKWTFDWDVEQVWFVGDRMQCLFRTVSGIVLGSMDLRAGAGSASTTTARLDMLWEATANSNLLEVPLEVAELWQQPVAFSKTGQYPGMSQVLQEDSRDSSTVRYRVLGAMDGDVFDVGETFRSVVETTPPVVRDSNDVPIRTQRSLLHKYVVTLENTGQFKYSVQDKFRPAAEQLTSPMIFGSPELGVGEPQVAGGQQYIPARVDMSTSRLILSTEDVYDLNITGLEYGYRYHQRYGRRR